MNKELFIKLLTKKNLVKDEKCIDKFDTYFDFLIQENAKYNLTSITNYEDVLEKHFYDSLSILLSANLQGKTIDIGSGGGFPGVPLKIANDNINLTCLDATAKKMNYINELSNKLDIKVDTVVARAEEYKEQYDNVIARGVASLNVLLELVCDIVKGDGLVIAMKGSHYQEELDQAKNAINTLGYQLINEYKYTLPSDESERTNLVFRKVKPHSPKYPRNYSQIKKKPL